MTTESKNKTDSWGIALASCNKAARILGRDWIDEKNMPANWDEMNRLHKGLWRDVYAKSKR